LSGQQGGYGKSHNRFIIDQKEVGYLFVEGHCSSENPV